MSSSIKKSEVHGDLNPVSKAASAGLLLMWSP